MKKEDFKEAGYVTLGWFLPQLVPVILGNLVGGSVLVGLGYHVIYQRAPDRNENA